jgi:hypothetical protein
MSGSARSTRRRALLLAVLSMASSVPATAAVIPDGSGPTMVLGPDGFGLVAYYDVANRDLKVAHCLDAVCSAVTIVTADAVGDVGARAAMAMGPGGPVIAYKDETNEDLKLAFCANAVCSAATSVVVDPDFHRGGDARIGVAIGTDGFPLIAYVVDPSGVALNGRLRVAHCENAGCTARTITDLGEAFVHESAPPNQATPVALAIGADGRGVILSSRSLGGGFITLDFRHCDDVACTSATYQAAATDPRLPSGVVMYPSVAIGPDGLPAYIYTRGGSSGPMDLVIKRCADALCSSGPEGSIDTVVGPTSLVVDAGGRPHVIGPSSPTGNGGLWLYECGDATCTTTPPSSCLAPMAREPGLVLDGAGQPLVAVTQGDRVVVARPSSMSCSPVLVAFDRAADEDDATPLPVGVVLSPPSTSAVTVAFATADGTALAGTDYAAVSGTLTFAPGETVKYVYVPLIDDAVDEAEETVEFLLSSASGATVVDSRAVYTIVDDENPTLSVSDCVANEGNAGTTACVHHVRLSFPTVAEVRAELKTQDDTTTPGDYIPLSSSLTFPPGTTELAVSVSVVGDLAPEPDESFAVLVFDLVQAGPVVTTGSGLILDDDWPLLPALELTHGSALVADVQSDPGPTADRDDYRLSLPPFTSHEVVLDAVSGDAAPGLQLQRIATDGSTVLQASTPVGTGAAASLRLVNSLAAAVDTQYVRVLGASCGTDCGPDDVYRLRAYETTGFIPRFNNAGSQASVLTIQNTTSRMVRAEAWFWDAAGPLVAQEPVVLGPRASNVLSTAGLPSLAGVSGSVTVTHDGPYGALAGKAVSLEPSTGFSFDSPLVFKPR